MILSFPIPGSFLSVDTEHLTFTISPASYTCAKIISNLTLAARFCQNNGAKNGSLINKVFILLKLAKLLQL